MKKANLSLFALLFTVAIGFAGQAHAQDVELGWMNIDRCRTVEWRNDGIFGTPSPTYHDSEQRMYATLHYTSITAESVGNYVASCAAQAAGAAGITALISDGAAAGPVFYEYLENCLGDTYYKIANLSISFDSRCM